MITPGAPDGKQETGAAERILEKPDAFLKELKKLGLEIFESKVMSLCSGTGEGGPRLGEEASGLVAFPHRLVNAGDDQLVPPRQGR